MSIEEVKKLVQKEMEAERSVEEAKRKATHEIETAQKEADRIIVKAKDPNEYAEYISSRAEAVKRKQKQIEKETREKVEQIRKVGKQNIERTIAMIVDLVLGVEI